MIISVKVKANARENRISRENDLLVIRIHAPAQEGKANKAIVEFLSEFFEVPKSAIEIVSGHTSAHKRIAIEARFDKVVTELLKAES